MPPIPRHTTGWPRSGKSRAKIFGPLHSAVARIRAYGAGRNAYIKSETFSALRHRPGGVGIAGTLDMSGFRPGWPALCVSVGTAVDDGMTGRFQPQTDGTGFGITCGKNGRSASGNTQLQVDEPRATSSMDQRDPLASGQQENRHCSTWGIKMKDHSTSRSIGRVNDELSHRREFVSHSTGFRAPNGSHAVPVDRHARFVRLVEPYAHLLRSLFLKSVRTDRCVLPCPRS